jgi:hypothetical protein
MKKWIYLILALAVIGAGVGYYLYNKPVQKLDSVTADATISAPDLVAAFETDEAAANALYLDKVVQVSGKVASATKDESGDVKLTLETGSPLSGVMCELDMSASTARADFQTGEEVTFKGSCTGFLSDVVLVRCVEVK